MVNYDPKEFTIECYIELLKRAVNKFRFLEYSEWDKCNNENVVFWRHDIDFSLEKAVEMAKIEHENCIKATYFLLLHSNYYNLFDRNSLGLVREILSYGHSIGLHFDCNYYKIQSILELIDWLTFEKNILQKLFNYSIEVFSFHNPSSLTMAFSENTYAGMINTYSKHFKTKVNYCSDSNGFWRFRSLDDVLNDDSINQLQVLTHPVWWTTELYMPREKIINLIEMSKKNAIAQYDHALLTTNRQNIS
ncbi:hypothetical protein [Legionella impletisoli]|uniref:Uncharacterized protein n=1 Tax=Legionella impletisoli TaxID=343510 RepID=A0A917JQ93_9GAMM|nr:hypothetical protein [Legionella impletisoli]GGI80017.1 hypothetical protein GCM10007966_05680 [Legionella impletisoli]